MRPVDIPNIRQNTPSYDELEAQLARDEASRFINDAKLPIEPPTGRVSCREKGIKDVGQRCRECQCSTEHSIRE